MKHVLKRVVVMLAVISLFITTTASGVTYAQDVSAVEENMGIAAESVSDSGTDDTDTSETNADDSGTDDSSAVDTDTAGAESGDAETSDTGAAGSNEEDLAGTDTDSDAAGEEEITIPSIQYQAHVAKKGWMGSVSEGQTAGTTGQALAMEAIQISLENIDSEEWEGSGITYSTHVQTYGWLASVSDGETSGTTGLAKRAEAITIELTGPIAEAYDVYYRVHSQTYGWLGWAKNGEKAGTSGYAKRMEAIQIVLVEKGGTAPGSTDGAYIYPRVTYQAHSQTVGWQSSVNEDVIAGTTGKAKRLEAIKISLSSELEYSGSIQYQVYVQKYGWMDWKSDGQLAGTVGESKRIEAVRIRLTGELAKHYDVYYSVHMAKIGWGAYACNGEVTGTIELSKRIEAIRICLVEKGVDTAPTASGTKYVEGYSKSALTYSAQIRGAGSTGTVTQSGVLGTTGQSKQLQNITLNLNRSSSSMPSGTIQYAAHVSKTGWTDWTNSGTACGSGSSSAGIEAVKIRLTGDLSKYYDIYYRAYVQDYGWLGWAKNGQAAGTTGISYRLEALQIVLVSKDASAPGANADYYTDQKMITVSDSMHALAMQYSSSTNYLILVDRDAHKVGIFTGSTGLWQYVYLWDCANGKASTPTVAGVFTVQNKGYYFDSGSSRCFWWTQFYGNYLFHSVLYTKSGVLQDGRVGMALSHGCVRLQIENAKWIYDNIPRGTTVVVY